MIRYSKLCTAGLFLLAPGIALANPSFNSYWSGSYFFIDATNSEEKEFSCSVTYQFEHDDFGTRKSRTHNANFVVRAASKSGDKIVPWKGNVVKDAGSWVRPTKIGEPAIQCN